MTDQFSANDANNQSVSAGLESASNSSPNAENSTLLIEQQVETVAETTTSISPPQKPQKNEVVQASSFSLVQWFSNLPVNRKQIAALVTSEVISVIGIAGIGAFFIWTTGHNQLMNQSKSEITVTELNYMIKIDQMGFGFRGQSDNTSIINAALLYQNKAVIPVALRQQVKRTLIGETLTRKIEYATLVGTDKKIIVNANSSRIGTVFDPDNLVTKVLSTGYQYKSSTIVTKEELNKERPKLPEGFKAEEALIRYTATPVKDPATKKTIGVLISGDIVNNKLPIVKATLTSFDGGYSAVYYQRLDGSFEQATSLQQSSYERQTNIPFDDLNFLRAAVEKPGQKITQQGFKINGLAYTITAMTMPNLWQQNVDIPVPIDNNKPPVAILVRGTPESNLNSLLTKVFLLQLVAVVVALLADTLFAGLLGRAIVKPIERLKEVTEQFAKGDRYIRANVTSTDEIGQLSATFNELADNITKSEQQERAEAQRKQWFADIGKARVADQLTVPLGELLAEVRQNIRVDRMIVYRFLPDGKGYVASESVKLGFPAALGDANEQSLMSEEMLESYRQGDLVTDNNIDHKNYHGEYLQFLKRLQVKSNVIVPIVQGEELFGLLIAHRCEYPHNWQPEEITYLQQLATPLGQALAGLGLLERKQADAEHIEEQNKQLQLELLQLLSDVEGAASGNLTVRAEISEGQIGIVADFFNAILENLRDIVTQVKTTTGQVNQSLGEEAGGIAKLAEESQEQAEKIQHMLDFVQEITTSIQKVANNATSAAMAARNASEVAQAGEVEMTQTVNSILNLRETVSSTAKKVKRLGEASQQISKVISLINEIALKTNLLAVNASIEAARAGEEGRGFAVVAEEVGQLAAQSATATKEIEQIVETIQLETQEVVKAMEIGTTQVVEGSRMVEKAKESLGQIVNESQQIDQVVTTISQSTVSQSESSQKVTNLMKEIAAISHQTSESSSEISTSLEKTVAVAKQLQESVEAFTVE
ncbi:MAG: methyl-accepting chemotaxis protein [Xenococcus sp. (in: cyanobacteria)]